MPGRIIELGSASQADPRCLCMTEAGIHVQMDACFTMQQPLETRPGPMAQAAFDSTAGWQPEPVVRVRKALSTSCNGGVLT